MADFFVVSSAPAKGLTPKRRTAACCRRWDDFAADAQLDKSERQNVRQVYAYCNEQLQAGKRLSWSRCPKARRRQRRASRNSPLST
ncbi:hypothetical protein MJ561_20485 [Klebsiella pneumoniae]|nr:hypothetical protein MJ561_20485 [Klebsiella pneumoniae]